MIGENGRRHIRFEWPGGEDNLITAPEAQEDNAGPAIVMRNISKLEKDI